MNCLLIAPFVPHIGKTFKLNILTRHFIVYLTSTCKPSRPSYASLSDILKWDIARNLHALLGQRESDAGLAPEILFLKDSVLSFGLALTAPGRYLIASHNAGFSWYGNAFDMQLWLLNVNGRFAE